MAVDVVWMLLMHGKYLTSVSCARVSRVISFMYSMGKPTRGLILAS